MANPEETQLVLDHKFDPESCRHTMNGAVSVLHCHHYASLYSRLAADCGMLDGKALLSEVAEDTFYATLVAYYDQHQVSAVVDRIAIAEQYYASTGLGQMKVACAGPESGEVELPHSHIDEGWIKKWGNQDASVNFVTCGYIAGMFAAIFGRASRTFSVKETASIVAGAECSKFTVTTL